MSNSPAPTKKKWPLWLSAVLGLFVLLAVATGLTFGLNLFGRALATPMAEPTKATGYQPNVGTPSLTGSAPGSTTATSGSAAPTLTGPSATTSAASTAGSGEIDNRFGLILTGVEGGPDRTASINRTLDLSQARWWYEYGVDQPSGVNPQAQQIYLVRTAHGGASSDDFKSWMDFIKQTGHFNKPTYWMISNEPNTPGQDDTTPEVYAEALYEANKTIRAADHQATIMGPNILNFDDTCTACPGFTSGHVWLDQTRQLYQTRYGSELPFDAWTIHTYNLDWDHLPLINQAQDIRQLEAYRTYLDSSPGTKGKPIWLTEFGVVWGYEGLEWQQTASGAYTALPKGNLRTDLMEKYLSDTLDWLENNADRLNIARWFVFTSYGVNESFSKYFGGIALFDGSSPTANLTNFGRIYTDRLKGVATTGK